MRNDLIVLEFSNRDRSEVLLDPRAIQQIVPHLEATLTAIISLSDARFGPRTPAAEIKLLLAAVEPGSIKIGFRALFGEPHLTRLQLIEALNATGGLIEYALIALIGAGHALGFLQPAQPAVQTEQFVNVELPAHVAQNVAVWKGIEGFVTGALGAGADHVTLTVPEQPTCVLVDASTDPRNLGSRGANIEQEYQGEVEAQLVLTGGPIQAAMDGNETQIYLGTATVGPALKQQLPALGTSHGKLKKFTVLVEWNSRRLPPEMNSAAVIVRGELMTLRGAKVQALEPVPFAFRDAAGVLRVRTLRVDE